MLGMDDVIERLCEAKGKLQRSVSAAFELFSGLRCRNLRRRLRVDACRIWILRWDLETVFLHFDIFGLCCRVVIICEVGSYGMCRSNLMNLPSLLRFYTCIVS